MQEDENTKLEALLHVDSKRRAFLSKMLAGGAALPAMSTVAIAAEKGKGKGGKGGQAGGKGKGGQAGGRGKGGRSRGGQQVDALKIASTLLDKFDKDQDNALNLDELKEAMAALYGGQISAGGRGGGKGKGGQSGKGKGGQAGKGKGDSQSSGGVTPKKPGEQ